jgi:hypothetical protein
MAVNNGISMNIKLSVLLLFLTVCCFSQAQTGPAIPCPDCDQNHTKPIPYKGSWYNPEQSGSGFLFDVQNDRLLGYYFGYDENGSADWALFSGQLQDGSAQGALWKVNASLEKFNNGACLNCDYAFPTQNGTLGEIELVFYRHAHASFSVNGGEVQHIVPLYFGYSANAYFNEQTTFAVPELEGWWTIFIDNNIMRPTQYNYSNYVVYIRKGRFSSGGELSFRTNAFPAIPEALDAGTIECSNQLINDQLQPTCKYATHLYFKLNIGNISSGRIYGETDNGDTLEMIRTSSDYCILSNIPEDCINTGIFDD